MRPFLLTVLFFICLANRVAADERDADVKPFGSSGIELDFPKFRAEVQRQTGNTILDLRKKPGQGTVKIPAGDWPFWKVVELASQQMGVAFSPYHADEALAAIDSTYRPLPGLTMGPFRLQVKRTTLWRDEESQTHEGALNLEIAWEPRLLPLYLELKDIAIVYEGEDPSQPHRIPRLGRFAVAGKNALEVELRFPGPKVAAGKLASLRGNLHAVGPKKMLDFVFANPAGTEAINKSEQGVKVRFDQWTRRPRLWTVRLTVDHPMDLPSRESYETFLSHHRLTLEKVNETVTASNVLEVAEKPNRSIQEIHFGGDSAPAPKGEWSDWTLKLRIPEQIVERQALFRLEGLRLPNSGK